MRALKFYEKCFRICNWIRKDIFVDCANFKWNLLNGTDKPHFWYNGDIRINGIWELCKWTVWSIIRISNRSPCKISNSYTEEPLLDRFSKLYLKGILQDDLQKMLLDIFWRNKTAKVVSHRISEKTSHRFPECICPRIYRLILSRFL